MSRRSERRGLLEADAEAEAEDLVESGDEGGEALELAPSKPVAPAKERKRSALAAKLVSPVALQAEKAEAMARLAEAEASLVPDPTSIGVVVPRYTEVARIGQPVPQQIRTISPAAPPPPPRIPALRPSTPTLPPEPERPTTMSDPQKDKKRAFQEPPILEMAELISQGHYPEVFVELRRILPGGSTSTLRKHVRIPITRWSEVGERFSTLLAGGGSFLLQLSADKNTPHFIAWKETFEGPVRMLPSGYTLAFDVMKADGDERADGWTVIQTGVAEMGGLPMTQGQGGMPMPGAPYNPYAQSLPPLPAGGPPNLLSPPGLPPFPAPSRDAYGRMTTPPEGYLDPWMRRFPVDQQWEMARASYQQKHQVNLPELSAAQVALQWNAREAREVEQARTQAARFEERLEATRDRSTTALDSERAARVNLERRISELQAELKEKAARSESERQSLELKREMELLKIRMETPAGRGAMADFVPLAAALAPVIGGYLTTQAQAQQQAQQQQMQFMQMMFAGANNKPSGLESIIPLLAAVAPIAAPALQQWLSNQDPEKVDEAKHNQDQRNLMMLKFMFDMMQSQQPQDEPEPTWLRLLRELGPTLLGMGRMAMLPGGQQRALPHPGHPGQNGPYRGEFDPSQAPPRGPAPAPGQTLVVAEVEPHHITPVAPPPAATYGLDIQGTVERFSQQNQQAAEMLGFILAQLSSTPGAEPFLTHEWAAILFHLHAQSNPEDVALLLCDHLEHSRTFALLPEVLMPVFTEPLATLQMILEPLPIGTIAPDYVKSVLTLASEELLERERERIAAESGELDEEAEEETEEETEEEPDAVEAPAVAQA